MGIKAFLQQFDEIEKRTERLIKICKSLEAENAELLKKNKQLEEELQNKAEAENSFYKERGLIRSKIDSLLAKLGYLSEADS